MSTAHAPDNALGEHGDHGHGAHPPHLAHHFDTPEQQFESGKLGMWVFLATEILMFGGLFCYYAYNRGNFPEVAEYSHHFLNPTWGAINTVVLLISSFTMAWGVRASQLGQKSTLNLMLVLTLAGAGMFMVIKAIEYTEKFGHDLYPGSANLFAHVNDPEKADETWAKIHHLEEEYGFFGHAAHAAAPAAAAPEAGADHAADGHATDGHASATDASHAAAAQADPADPGTTTPDGQPVVPQTAHFFTNPAEHSVIMPAAVGPTGSSAELLLRPVGASVSDGAHELPRTFAQLSPLERQRVPSFFSIYYLMTGLHGIHVLIGIGLIAWLLIRSLKGDFSPDYYAPVDIVGLYWHLVDLIWIFLFPLLYLID